MFEMNGHKYEDKLIMTVHVTLDFAQISEMTGKAGSVSMIPFGGTVEGELFNGVVLPGGCDTQVEDLAGARHMSARYMLEGTANTGEKGRIYIENNGWFTNGQHTNPFLTVPTFFTNIPGISDYLHTNQFITRGFGKPTGPDICIYQLTPIEE